MGHRIGVSSADVFRNEHENSQGVSGRLGAGPPSGLGHALVHADRASERRAQSRGGGAKG